MNAALVRRWQCNCARHTNVHVTPDGMEVAQHRTPKDDWCPMGDSFITPESLDAWGICNKPVVVDAGGPGLKVERRCTKYRTHTTPCAYVPGADRDPRMMKASGR